MRILILGAGKMGSFLCDALSQDHDVAIMDRDAERLRYTFGVRRFTQMDEVREFQPELMINAVTVKYTCQAFDEILPYLPADCILSDIASVKTMLPDYYAKTGHRFVSTHPMFGPTFANLSDLHTQNAIIISESDCLGKAFFRELYSKLHLNIFDYTFAEHDLTMAYSLSIPFASTLAFASVMKHQDAPGTTFKKHLAIAEGLFSEDDFLLCEILLNPHSCSQLQLIQEHLANLQSIIKERNYDKLLAFINQARRNIR